MSDNIVINIPFVQCGGKVQISPFEFERQFAKGKVVDLTHITNSGALKGKFRVVNSMFDVCGITVALEPCDAVC